MNILLTNDDGYLSSGLMLLCEKLSSCGHNVYVVAPDGQRSAFSHSVNLRNEMTIRKLDSYCGAKEAYISAGSPADCVKFAVSVFPVKFDLLISGPNNGENSGYAVLYSGTVAAAEEGALCGIKSIALSRVGWFADGGSFSTAVEYVSDNLEALSRYCTDVCFLNVNVPCLAASEISGVKVCPLNPQCIYNDVFEASGVDTWKVVGRRIEVDNTQYNDIALNSRGYITVTPISLSRTDFEQLRKMKDLEK